MKLLDVALDWTVAICSLAAAALWFWSASVDIPPGGGCFGGACPKEFDPQYIAIAWQSKLSADAAISAAVAALAAAGTAARRSWPARIRRSPAGN